MFRRTGHSERLSHCEDACRQRVLKTRASDPWKVKLAAVTGQGGIPRETSLNSLIGMIEAGLERNNQPTHS